MSWERIEANWKKFRDSAKLQWGKLTDDQLEATAGKRECLAARIQESYGITRDEAEKQLGAWQVLQKLNGARMDYEK